MSDEANRPEESQPQEEPFEPEPDEGPLEREREFLQERITRTRSRSESGLIAGTEPAAIPVPLEPELQDEAARKAWSDLAEQRRQALGSFRQRRVEKLR